MSLRTYDTVKEIPEPRTYIFTRHDTPFDDVESDMGPSVR